MQKARLFDDKLFSERPFSRLHVIVAFATLLGITMFTRLWDLGWKTMMHDELLFVFYTHAQFYKSWSYVYAPILHGPMMLHLQNIVFHLFGVSDYTARLGVALLGIGGFFWLWKLRYWLGEAGTWFVLLFYSLSPGITFFQRFFHMDALYLFNTLWIIASGANWWRTRDGRWAVSFIMAIMALFCNKASCVFVYFTMVTYLLILIIHDLTRWFFEGRSPATTLMKEKVPTFPNPIWPTLVIGGFIVLCLTQVFEGIIYDADVRQAIGHDWVLRDIRSIPIALGWVTMTPQSAPDAGGLIHRDFWAKFYIGGGLGLLLAFGLVKVAVSQRLGHREFLADTWRRLVASRLYVIGGLALATAFYTVIYTMWFRDFLGLFETFARTWSYWGGQHEWGRIPGPFHQHLLNILLYELPSVLIIAAIWIGALWRVPKRRDVGMAFLLMILAVGAFHALMFSGKQIDSGTPGVYTTLQVPYLKIIFKVGLLTGILLMLFPRAARAIVPAAFLGLVAWSLVYLSSSEWEAARLKPLYQNGEPIRMMGRHLNLADYMEIQFNFDWGWNVALVMGLIFLATLHTWNAISAGKRFQGYLIWSTLTMFGSAAYAREAVPQVGIHAMLPVILLAGSYVNDIVPRLHSRGARTLFAIVIGIMVLWNTKATFNLNFRNADNPAERMAYGPHNRDIKNHMKYVVDYVKIAPLRMGPNGQPLAITEHNQPGRHKDVKVFLEPLDQVGWPAKWYLRDVEYTETRDNATVQRVIREKWDFLFLSLETAAKFPDLAKDYHLMRGRGTHFWTPNPISPASLGNIWKEAIPGHYLDMSPQAGQAYDAKQDWYRLWRYLMLRETFDGSNRPFPSMSTFDYVFCIRRDLP
jgi:predicted membrane-bound mannosyltransferase